MTVRHTIRFPDDLYARVQRAAEEDMRSLNAEVLWLIERGLTAAESTSSSP